VRAAVSLPRPAAPEPAPRARSGLMPLAAWEVWVRPAGMAIALAFLHLGAVFTAYRCLATEQALRQSLARQSRAVATLSARVAQAEQEVLRVVPQSGLAPVPDRSLTVTIPVASRPHADPTAPPCHAWAATQIGCLQAPSTASAPPCPRPSGFEP
jgi:hypothetical protein